MKRINLYVFPILLILNVMAISAHSTIVYDNTTTSLGYLTPILTGSSFTGDTSYEAGDQITLASTERSVTEIDILISSAFATGGTADAQVRFYENDGTGGKPGTILWDSGVLNDLPYVPGANTFTFIVPHAVVPDTFTWTIYLSGRTGSAVIGYMGPQFYNPPTVGSSNDFIWAFDGTSWNSFNDPQLVDNYAARVSAVPEPATMLLLGSGLIGLAGYGRKKFFKK